MIPAKYTLFFSRGNRTQNAATTYFFSHLRVRGIVSRENSRFLRADVGIVGISENCRRNWERGPSWSPRIHTRNAAEQHRQRRFGAHDFLRIREYVDSAWTPKVQPSSQTVREVLGSHTAGFSQDQVRVPRRQFSYQLFELVSVLAVHSVQVSAS